MGWEYLLDLTRKIIWAGPTWVRNTCWDSIGIPGNELGGGNVGYVARFKEGKNPTNLSSCLGNKI